MERVPSHKMLHADWRSIENLWRAVQPAIKSQYPSVVSDVRIDETSGSIPILERQDKFAVHHSGYLLAFNTLHDAEMVAAGVLLEMYGIEFLFDHVTLKTTR